MVLALSYSKPPHTWPNLTKRFTNLKVNLKGLRLYIGAKMQLVTYEFEYCTVVTAVTAKACIRINRYPDIRYTSPILPLFVSTRWQFLSICQIIFGA